MPASSSFGSVDQRAADDPAIDLVGPAVDPRRAGLDPGPADRVLAHVAVAAVQLQAAVEDAFLQLAAAPLGDRRVLGAQLVGEELLQRPVEERLPELEVRLALGELEAGVLEVGD